jgi:predicted O-methyltransferase YrrM
MANTLFRRAIHIPGFRYANMIPRSVHAFADCISVMGRTARWLVSSREDTNWTYDLLEQNLVALACTISCITGVPKETVFAHMKEGNEDQMLRDHIARHTKSSIQRVRADATCRFGRRLGAYAVARVMKPRVVVETGVDKGLGSVLLAAALLRNRDEGFAGQYYGIDINPRAGWLLRAPYDAAGKILYGDSVTILEKIEAPIDLFITDSDRSTVYEAEEYRVVQPKLGKGGIIVGNYSDSSEALIKLSIEKARDYLFFGERPKDHWYRGGGLGFGFDAREVRERLEDIREEREATQVARV